MRPHLWQARALGERVQFVRGAFRPALPIRQLNRLAMHIHVVRREQVAAGLGQHCPVRSHFVIADYKKSAVIARREGLRITNKQGYRMFKVLGFPIFLSV